LRFAFTIETQRKLKANRTTRDTKSTKKIRSRKIHTCCGRQVNVASLDVCSLKVSSRLVLVSLVLLVVNSVLNSSVPLCLCG